MPGLFHQTPPEAAAELCQPCPVPGTKLESTRRAGTLLLQQGNSSELPLDNPRGKSSSGDSQSSLGGGFSTGASWRAPLAHILGGKQEKEPRALVVGGPRSAPAPLQLPQDRWINELMQISPETGKSRFASPLNVPVASPRVWRCGGQSQPQPQTQIQPQTQSQTPIQPQTQRRPLRGAPWAREPSGAPPALAGPGLV